MMTIFVCFYINVSACVKLVWAVRKPNRVTFALSFQCFFTTINYDIFQSYTSFFLLTAIVSAPTIIYEAFKDCLEILCFVVVFVFVSTMFIVSVFKAKTSFLESRKCFCSKAIRHA